ncbi:ABC transporter substrate-binding protein/permease [Oenococcus kitaharae]|uniref:ABC-type amino acid transport system permease component n=1 Tax=Oenococcus kitaharae DSM 17330 TaxID=1045004 RepID=G9WF60_9LACO|nr:ABC transporter substrate-binding protein/permease [Oenococcus kitaharae]EHN58780.1 ABC-type amino acid transport system permease component [Oenococcus kitaharae DSM 17330]OEY81875.1 amino acid ABC transporter substrate-binding protein [Oenococcus kitaharae]OEY84104.1 amino acid ABC transporter substrate-binding protein [Oenococcus kitaharae]OEY85536.1 amino acid ABC transporter substrate-binding protein [Oenococcus kitaharae]
MYLKQKRSWLSIIGLLFAVFVIAAGTFPSSQAQAAKKSKKVFLVGMEANYPPFNWTQQDASNGAVPIQGSNLYANGYDVQVSKRIAKRLGRPVEVAKTEWDGLLPALTSGKIDAIIAGMTPTPEREKTIDFTRAYYNSKQIIVVNKNSKYAKAKTLKDFKGAKLTGQLSTVQYDLIKQIKGAIREPAMRDFSSMRVALQSNTIDGYVAELPEGYSMAVADPNATYINLSSKGGFVLDKTESQEAIGLRKNDPNKATINSVLSKLPNSEQSRLMQQAVKEQPQTSSQGNWFIDIWQQYGGMLLRGIGMTLLLAIVGTAVGFIIGLLIGIVRTIPAPKKRLQRYLINFVNWLLSVYIEVFRGTPMIVQAAVFYYGAAQAFGINLDRTTSALIIVSINTGAYLAEIIRGGIISIDQGQFEAATALGMTHFQQMNKIVLPQAVRNSIPAVTNEFIVNIKDTSVLSIISVSELFFTGSTIAGQNFQFFHTYLTISLIYLIMTFTITRIFRLIEKKLNGPKNYDLMTNDFQIATPKIAGK